jgi:hypothetical protein
LQVGKLACEQGQGEMQEINLQLALGRSWVAHFGVRRFIAAFFPFFLILESLLSRHLKAAMNRRTPKG